MRVRETGKSENQKKKNYKLKRSLTVPEDPSDRAAPGSVLLGLSNSRITFKFR